MLEGYRRRSVLVVEDDPVMRMNLAAALQDADFSVQEAGCAAEATDLLEHGPEIDIVVTDVQMPGLMDGRGLARFIRDRWPSTIVVIASGADAVPEYELSTRSAFLAKPFRPTKLLDMIDRLSTQ